MAPQLFGHVDFNPSKDIPSLKGKVVFVTGGTSGLGRESVLAFAEHQPEHIYFTGRNAKAAESLGAAVKEANNGHGPPMTFLEMDMTSLPSVKAALAKFTHSRLDILMCNAGIMAQPPALSKDGYELQFAVNHLANAMVTKHLVPILENTAALPGSDVRIVILTSEGHRGHYGEGIHFNQLKTPMSMVLGPWLRYGQSKLANVVYGRELARRYPNIMTVSLHPGVIETGLVTNAGFFKRCIVYFSQWIQGITLLQPEQGCLNQMWLAAGAKRSELVNGGVYYPIGVLKNDTLSKTATSPELAAKLWNWTDQQLAKF